MLALGVFSPGYAQFTKGRILAGGDFSISTNRNKSNSTVTSKYTTIQVSPKAGYFVMDNLAIGLSLGLGASSGKTESTSGNSENSGASIGLEPFVRYYLPQRIFFQGQFGYASSSYKVTYGGTTTKSTNNSTTWAIGAGYAYFLNNNIALEPFLGYRSRNNDNGGPTQSSLFLNIGFQLYFSKKGK